MVALSDVCECGDYRSQHDGDGPCRICKHHMNTWDDCQQFRFSHHASPTELEHWEQFNLRRDPITGAAAILGSKGGKTKSEAKAESSRQNGKKGGRPKKEAKQ